MRHRSAARKRGVGVLLAALVTVLAVAAPSPVFAAEQTPSKVLCTGPLSAERNVLANCNEPDAPHNETAVAVNPHNPLNIVVGVNDYQWINATTRTLLSRAHVSFTGGRNWTDVQLPFPAECTFTGDPSLAFDAAGTVYYATVCIDTGSVQVTSSRNGGLSWTPQTTVAAGTPTVFHDHPVLAAWGRGNVVVTWVQYGYTTPDQTQITTAPVAAAVSHDSAKTFGSVQMVSGASPDCVGLTAPQACDQTWGNAVTATRDGVVVATFYNTTKYRPDGVTNLGRNTHFAMRLDPATGALSAGPFTIGLAYDGIETGDLPVNVDGRQTLHDSQFRLLMQGNIAADPTNSRHLAVVWFDNRNGPRPVSTSPYGSNTDSDVIVSHSYDQGTTWSAPTAIRAAGDQFFAWAAYDAAGRLRVGYHDRSYDPDNHRYGYTLASETRPGNLQFSRVQVTTALSDPTRNNRWSVTTVNPNFPNATRFIGDYSGIATVGNAVVATWTDQRRESCLFGTCGHNANTYAAVELRR